MWILLLFRLIPPSLSELLNRTILCNPNSSLKRALRTVTRLSAFDRLDARRIVGFSGAAEMMQYRSDALEILPRSTSDLIREERTTFDGISQLFNFKVEHPVEISIGVKSIVITTVCARFVLRVKLTTVLLSQRSTIYSQILNPL